MVKQIIENDKQKLMFLIPSLDVGGAEKVTLNILNKISKSNNEIILVVLNGDGPLKNIVPRDVKLIIVNANRLRYAIFAIAKILIKIKPDYIFSTIGYLNITVIFLKQILALKAKLIIREASTPSKYFEQMTWVNKTIQKKLYKYLYPKADKIIAQCENMKSDLVKFFGIPMDKVVRIYNPIDINDIGNKSKEYFPIEFDNNSTKIVAVGRLVEAKGFDTLLKAFKKLTQLNSIDMQLYIIGEGPLKNKLIELALKLNISERVNFVGFIENPYPYIMNADLFVLSSRWEGFPNTLLEALACNKKVVATDCQSGPKEILGDNEYGLLASVDNPVSLCRKMDNYLRIENKSGNRASYFDIDKIIIEYEELFI
jgi:glycosyltransferase involved in cell wall biosynthesis